jgi:hypothetical protein
MISLILKLLALLWCEIAKAQERDTNESHFENLYADQTIVTASYNAYGDYGVFLGNFAASEFVSGNYITYDQRWFEMLTWSSGGQLDNSLEIPEEQDRFLFYATKSMPNLIRALARMIVDQDNDLKGGKAKILLGDLMKNRNEFMKNEIPDDFIFKMQTLVSNLDKPSGIISSLQEISENDKFKNALLERIYLQMGAVKYTNSSDFIDFLDYIIQMFQLVDTGKSTSVHLTPDYSQLLGNIINQHCLSSDAENNAIKKFFESLKKGRRDLLIGLWYYLNITPIGLECIQKTLPDQQNQFFNRKPPVFFFPRVQYPAYPKQYLVHAPTFNRKRRSRIGLYSYSSRFENNSMPLIAGHTISDQALNNSMKLQANLTDRGILKIESYFKTMAFRIREVTRRNISLTIDEAHSVPITVTNITASTQKWILDLSQLKNGEIIGLWNGEIDALPHNFLDLINQTWNGSRREILLQISAIMKMTDFIHVLLIESQPKPIHIPHI